MLYTENEYEQLTYSELKRLLSIQLDDALKTGIIPKDYYFIVRALDLKDGGVSLIFNNEVPNE